MPEQISSIKDERIVEARELSTAAGRQLHRKCLLEGDQSIQWALEAHTPVERVFYDAKLPETHALLQDLRTRNIPCFAVTDGILKKISDTRYVIPFIGVAVPHVSDVSRKDFVIVLDQVKDHGNIGTIIRTAKAFGIRQVFSTSPDCDLFYKKTIEASRGKVFEVRLQTYSSAAETARALKERGYQLVVTSPHAPRLQSAAQLRSKPVALVVGNETDGVSSALLEAADLSIQIPMSGRVESLNVGVATGISVYELKLKLVIAMLVNYIRSTLGRDVNVTGKHIEQALDARLRKLSPFNSRQIILLMILKCDEVMTLDQVGKDTAAFGEELQALLTPLADGGYLCYTDEQTKAEVRFTSAGEHLLGELWNVVEAVEEELLAGFSDQERTQLLEFLQRIRSNADAVVNGS